MAAYFLLHYPTLVLRVDEEARGVARLLPGFASSFYAYAGKIRTKRRSFLLFLLHYVFADA